MAGMAAGPGDLSGDRGPAGGLFEPLCPEEPGIVADGPAGPVYPGGPNHRPSGPAAGGTGPGDGVSNRGDRAAGAAFFSLAVSEAVCPAGGAGAVPGAVWGGVSHHPHRGCHREPGPFRGGDHRPAPAVRRVGGDLYPLHSRAGGGEPNDAGHGPAHLFLSEPPRHPGGGHRPGAGGGAGPPAGGRQRTALSPTSSPGRGMPRSTRGMRCARGMCSSPG